MTTKNISTLDVDFNLIRAYYQALDLSLLEIDDEPLLAFRNEHPLEFSFFNRVHCKRSKVKRTILALKATHRQLYFGCLTFNPDKDKNSVVSKRREAFRMLNKLFEAFFVIEELGEDKDRYHIHFVGFFKRGFGFDDFVQSWHSRQNIEKVIDIKKVSQYLVKYITKQLPRVRRNHACIRLEKAYRSGKRLERVGFECIGIEYQVAKVL